MCPDCKEPLLIVEFEGVELDYCPRCRGSWFDAGELELIAEQAGASTEPLRQALHSAGRPGTRCCPRCNLRLEMLPLPGSITVDRCPTGEGLWLDAGELTQILQKHAGRADAPVVQFLNRLFGETTEKRG